MPRQTAKQVRYVSMSSKWGRFPGLAALNNLIIDEHLQQVNRAVVLKWTAGNRPKSEQQDEWHDSLSGHEAQSK